MASNSYPSSICVYLKLLDLIEALMLECQVSIKDFCSAFKFLCPFSPPNARDFYSSLIDSFEEYR